MRISTLFQKRKSNPKKTNKEEMLFPIFCKVYAVKSPDHQGAIVQSRVGDKLLVVSTPSEDHPYCVSVYSITLNRVLGFIEETLAEKLTATFGENFCRDGEVEQITGGPPYRYYGCNIRVMDTQYFIEDMHQPSP